MVKRITSIWVHLAGAAACSALLAYVALQVFRPAPGLPPPATTESVSTAPDPVASARLFGQPGNAASPSDFPLILAGAYIAGKHSAVVATVDGRHQRVFLVGQEMTPGVTLSAVHADRIVIDQHGVSREFPLPVATVAQASTAPSPRFLQGRVLSAPSVDGPAPAAAIPRGTLPVAPSAQTGEASPGASPAVAPRAPEDPGGLGSALRRRLPGSQGAESN
jgi:hypothetical protein